MSEPQPCPIDRPARRAPVRWGRLVGWSLLALVVLVPVALYVSWGRSAEQEVQALVQAIRDRGEPLAWWDFRPPAVADANNAVELYKQAIGVSIDGEAEPGAATTAPAEVADADVQRMLLDLVDSPAYRRRHGKQARAILSRAAEALTLCRRARRLAGVDWKLAHDGPAIMTRVPSLGEAARLCQLLCLAALEAHDAGNDAKAIEYLRDALRLGRSLHAMPILVGHLVGLGIDGQVCTTIEQIAPRLAVGATGRSARPEQARELLRDFLDERVMHQGLVLSMMGERSIGYDTAERVRRGELDMQSVSGVGVSPLGSLRSVLQGAGQRLIGGVFADDEVTMLEHMNSYVAAARKDTYPQALAAVPAFPMPSGWRLRMNLSLTAILLPSLTRCYKLHYRQVAMRRMAATALAIRMGELDRSGKRPGRLDELVPRYLRAVPLDPFAADGRALGYLPGAARPRLYSVYENGKDDSGAFAVQSGGIDSVHSLDWVYFLDGARPYPEPADDANEPATE